MFERILAVPEYRAWLKFFLIFSGVFGLWWVIGGPVLDNESVLKLLMRENRVMEMLGALCFAGAAVVGVYIAVLGLQPIRTNVSTLMDRAPADLRQRVHEAARAETMVLDVEAVRIHPLGSYYMVDLEIGVDGKLSLEVAHTIAHRVGDLVRAAVPHVHDVKVHVNPR